MCISKNHMIWSALHGVGEKHILLKKLVVKRLSKINFDDPQLRASIEFIDREFNHMSKSTLISIIEDFLLQDTSLMDYLWFKIPIYSRTEIVTRTIIFVFLSFVLLLIIKPQGLFIVLVLLLGHALNWFFNGHGYQILYSILNVSFFAKKAVKYISKLKSEVEHKGLHVMVIGSWSTGTATRHSDIDILVLNIDSKGIIYMIKLGLLSSKYRLLALFNILSVDIYVIDKIEYLQWRKKRKPMERPIVINDPMGIISRIYEKNIIAFEDFIKLLYEIYV